MSIVAGPNPFALALIYYFDYRRNKLQPELLLKIAKKYKSCPEKLLVDLQNKYNHPISNITPTIQHILRIFSVTAIPNEYLLLLPSEWKCNSEQYIAQCDPLRDTFDASIVLSQKCLHIGSNSTKLFDNLSKIKHLISSLKVPLSSSIVNLTSTITKLPTEQTITETTVTMNSTTISTTNAPKYTHVIHRIAQSTVETAPSLTVGNTGSCSGSSSSKRKRSHGERIAKDKFTTVDLEASDVDSPFQLIYNIMTEKRRACILIRRHPNVHSYLVGYVRAFDRHMNLVITDVDETIHYEKPANNARTHSITKQKQRHHPQILVRGDCVVWIRRADMSIHAGTKIGS